MLAGYGARVPAAAVGRPLEAWVAVTLAHAADGTAFEAAIGREPAIVEAVHITGAADYEVRALCADTGEVDALVRRLKSEHGAARTETRIVLDRTFGPALLPPPRT